MKTSTIKQSFWDITPSSFRVRHLCWASECYLLKALKTSREESANKLNCILISFSSVLCKLLCYSWKIQQNEHLMSFWIPGGWWCAFLVCKSSHPSYWKTLIIIFTKLKSLMEVEQKLKVKNILFSFCS